MSHAKSVSSETPEPLLSDRSHEILKQTVQIVLPAAGTLYFTVAQIWGIPHAADVVGTIAAINIFLGVVLGMVERRYAKSDVRFDGSLDVTQSDEGQLVVRPYMTLTATELEEKGEVLFKVVKV